MLKAVLTVLFNKLPLVAVALDLLDNRIGEIALVTKTEIFYKKVSVSLVERICINARLGKAVV